MGETREKRKIAETNFLQAAEWVRRLAEETAAFEVAKVVEAQPERGERRPMEWDYVITLSFKPDHRRVDLFVQTRQQLSPATVLGLFPRLRWVPPDGVLLVCAPYISPRVTELCREKNVCYLDGVGNCRIAAPGLFIHVSGRPNRPASGKATIDPFSRKSSRVVRLLLTHPAQCWQVQQQEVSIAEGIAILREKFARLDSIGPVWAAQTAEGATAGTAFDLETEQRRAYELVNALLRQIDELK